MTTPLDRAPATTAGPELLVLQRWEESSSWLLNHTARWPKSARFTLAQRIENHALDVLEQLVQARYEPTRRAALLCEVNLRLERLRFLWRAARDARVEHARGFEQAMRRLDEVGRMVHGWRVAIGARQPQATRGTGGGD
ncbi:MAG: diversity-generating retroelement protein Avd [Planctomycetes bacterium]|nr:diversity-generating retroelement protein Avd [Planctomycetota bacterium]